VGTDRLTDVGSELRRLRLAAGLSGVRLAVLAGVPQSTVSRVENGARVADPETVMAMFAALGVAAADRARLDGLVRAAYEASVTRRVDAGVSFRRSAPAELARSAASVRCFESALMPAPLRTEDYCAASGLADGGPAAVALLADQSRAFTFVLTEAALRTWPGTGEFMPDQLAHLLAQARQPNVRLGVVPAAYSPAVPRGALPLHGFTLYDDAAVSVSTFTRTLTLTADDDVLVYREVFAALEHAAVFGQEAADLVNAAAREFAKFAKR
jgi:transcriptional regulator with XRE-family HTH domain